MIEKFSARRNERGFTLAELITVVAIIGILAALALPVARYGIQRQREAELRYKIRRITDAIDRYHDLRISNMIQDQESLGQEKYPKSLEELVEGVDLVDGTHVKFLRERDLIDPITGKKEWNTTSSTDDPESSFTDSANVFDVHSKSNRLSLDGETRYSEW